MYLLRERLGGVIRNGDALFIWVLRGAVLLNLAIVRLFCDYYLCGSNFLR